jgi:hypothetical protein
MAKVKPAPEERTDFSWAENYIDDRIYGRLKRIQVNFPLINDRKAAGNIDYSSDEEKRTWRGKVPEVGRKNTEKSIKGSYSLDESQFKYVNSAPNINNIPEGYIATVSGVEPLVDEPFTAGPQQGYPTDNPVEINEKFQNNVTSGEFFIGMNIETEYPRYPYRYTTSGVTDNRMEWRISPDFDNPTEPEVRYPRQGAFKIKK